MGSSLLNNNFGSIKSPDLQKAKHLTIFDITRKPHFASVFMSCRTMKQLSDQGVELNVLLFDYSFIEREGTYQQKVQRIDIYKEYFKYISKLAGLDFAKINFIDAVKYFRVASGKLWNNLHGLTRTIELDIPEYRSRSQDFQMASYLRELFYMSAIRDFNPDIYHSGMDENWAHKLAALEPDNKIKYVITHEVLPKFAPKLEPQTSGEFQIVHKMSKYDSQTAIDCREKREIVAKKINGSYCLEGDLKNNAVLNWVKETVYKEGKEFKIIRPAKWGGNLTVKSFLELAEQFEAKAIHPFDLKSSYTGYFTDWTEDIRKELEQSQIFEDYGFVYQIP
jgi:tyrosyl-tRNA synthetase